MERIKQALEKARIERNNLGGSPSSPSRSSRTDMPAQLSYTQTRTVSVSSANLQEKRIITGIEQDTFSDAYKILRTQVLQRLREKNWNSLAITSPGLNEGKTLTAINLAISLALEVNYTVLLVDADLRHPSVHNYFGFEAQYGLSDYLTADRPLSELLVHPDGIPGFVILPGGKPLANSAEMLNSPKMAHLVDELKTRYPSRIILFDLPPLLSAADTLAFSPYVDAALLVIEDGKTLAEDANQAIGLLQGTNVIGTVLNKSLGNMPQAEGAPWGWTDRLLGNAQLIRSAIMSGFDRLRRKKS